MAEHFQLDLFPDTIDVGLLQSQVDAIKISTDKVRKSQFAKIGELKKVIIDLEERLTRLEKGICNGK